MNCTCDVFLNYWRPAVTDLYLKYVNFSNYIPESSVAFNAAVVVTGGEPILSCCKIKFTRKFNLLMCIPNYEMLYGLFEFIGYLHLQNPSIHQ